MADDPFNDPSRKRRRLPWAVAVLVLGAAGAGVYYVKRTPARTVQYVTAPVSRGDVEERVETSGTVQPIVQVQVGSQVSGRVLRVLANYNDRVRAHQVLAELDPTPFRAAVAQARAAVQAAQAQLQRAQANSRLAGVNLRRAEELRARGLNAPSDLDAARGQSELTAAEIAVARAEIARTQAALTRVETDLAYTRIVAPIDGVVIQRAVEEGQTVAASFQSPVLFQIANDLSRMQVMAAIDEADIAKVRRELMAEARVDAFPGEVFRGVVTEVRYGSVTTAGVVTYPAVVVVENPALKLRPGMTATVSVTSARHPDVLRVPNAALRYEPGAFTGAADAGVGQRPSRREQAEGNGGDGGRRGRVFVLRDGRPAPVRVRVGIVDDALTEVSGDGLTAGTQVVTDEIDLAPQTSARQPGAMGVGGSGGRGMRGVR